MLDHRIVSALNALPNDQLRQVIAHAAGIHASRDRDGGSAMATALDRISARLRQEPRRTSHG
jgi:hypothetical protein